MRLDCAGKILDLRHPVVMGVLNVTPDSFSDGGHYLRLADALRRARVGDRYVLEQMLAENLLLGGESSGHIICLDRTSTGDGIVSALQILSAMLRSGKSLHDLKAGMSKYPQTLINVSVAGRVDLERAPIQEAVRAAESQLGDYGRVLLRPSGTEPVVRVMVEGADAGAVERHARELAAVVRDTLSV